MKELTKIEYSFRVENDTKNESAIKLMLKGLNSLAFLKKIKVKILIMDIFQDMMTVWNKENFSLENLQHLEEFEMCED